MAGHRWKCRESHEDVSENARLSLGGDNKLMVVLEDGLASDYFKGEAHEQNKQQLEMLLSDFPAKRLK